MTISVYCFEDAEGNEFGSFNTQNYEEAKRFASENRLRIVARVFEFADSEYLDDFTGADTEADDEGDEDDD